MKRAALVGLLFTFTTAHAMTLLDLTAPGFFVVNDGVMGGLSTSRVNATNGVLTFEGEVSLANSGGFASCRSPVAVPAGKGALLLTVRGDGQRYRLTLKRDDAPGTPQYQANFVAPREWVTVRFTAEDFVASFRGRRVAAPPLRFEEMRYVGLLIADQQAGPFRIDVRALTAD